MEDDETIADAEAQDYNELIPKEPECKYNVFCHIFAALILSAIVVGLATLGIMAFS